MVITILKIIFILSYSNSITQQTSKKAVRKTVIYNKYNKTAVEFEVPRLLIIGALAPINPRFNRG